MSILMNNQTGAFVGPVLHDSPLYRALIKLRQAGQPLRPVWEDTGIQDFEAVEAIASVAAVVPAAAAGNDTTTTLVASSPAGTLSYVDYIPNADMVGQATNFRTLNLVDQTGPVTLATLALSAATTILNGGQANRIPVSATAVAAGDQLRWTSVHTGTGLADPGGFVVVTFAGGGSRSLALDYSLNNGAGA